MQTDLQANEFKIYTSVQAELRDALRRKDKKTACLAIEELAMLQYSSTWPRLRACCASTIAEFQ